MDNQITKETMLNLLEEKNFVEISNNENVLIFHRFQKKFSSKNFGVEFNGKFLKDSARIGASLYFFNELLKKHKISIDNVLEEYVENLKEKEIDLTSFKNSAIFQLLKGNPIFNNSIATSKNWEEVLDVIDLLKLKMSNQQLESIKTKFWD